MDTKVSGVVEIRGSANIEGFQFYKVEFRAISLKLSGYTDMFSGGSVDEMHRTPVVDGVLEAWDTDALPEGSYLLILTVVDNTGNYPPPCAVRVVLEKTAG